jgi:hypothetical protein
VISASTSSAPNSNPTWLPSHREYSKRAISHETTPPPGQADRP